MPSDVGLIDKRTGVWRVEIAEHIFGDDRPFPSCHASTLVETPGGEFLAAWFGGTAEKESDVGIWLSQRSAAGRWSQPIQVAKVRPLTGSGQPEPVEGRQSAHWNPVLFLAPDGAVHLFFKVGDSIPIWETWTIVSVDGGRSWSAPRELVPGNRGGRGPVKNKPIVLSDGSWLAPASIEAGPDGDHAWDVFVDRSTDGGRTWQRGEFIPLDHAKFEGGGVIQPTLWESAPGRVHMLTRSTAYAICRSDSNDFGRTWCPVYKTALPNNSSGIDLTRLADGTLVLAFTPVPHKIRTPLSLAISRDNGATWTDRLDIETQPGQYAYPAVIPSGRGVAITYTWRREHIAFWKGWFEKE